MKNTLIIFTVFVLAVSCAPKLSFTWTKPEYQGVKYKKVAIFSSGKNLQLAMEFQDTMVEYLKNEGVYAVSGMSMINPTQLAGLDPMSIKRILMKEGVDAVLSVTVVDKEKSTQYVQGTNNYMYGGYGYGGFGGYYGRNYGAGYYDPGYYQETTSYLLENHFYEVKEGEDTEEALVWASQSELSDPGKSIAKTYSKLLVNTLLEENIIK